MIDEAHRLTPMPVNYDTALFNQLYKETRELRHKLAFGIDCRKFGVDYKEVLSWFDVKFLYAFNKYYDNPMLKGYIIRALQTYKMRIVKNSYLNKNSLNNSIDIDEVYDLEIPEENNELSQKENLIQVIRKYYKDRLSPEAYLLWDVELNPPHYLLKHYEGRDRLTKPTDEMILDYFSCEVCEETLDYLRKLRREIREITSRAKEYFSYQY